jgi:hypothetical protein
MEKKEEKKRPKDYPRREASPASDTDRTIRFPLVKRKRGMHQVRRAQIKHLNTGLVEEEEERLAGGPRFVTVDNGLALEKKVQDLEREKNVTDERLHGLERQNKVTDERLRCLEDTLSLLLKRGTASTDSPRLVARAKVSTDSPRLIARDVSTVPDEGAH